MRIAWTGPVAHGRLPQTTQALRRRPGQSRLRTRPRPGDQDGCSNAERPLQEPPCPWASHRVRGHAPEPVHHPSEAPDLPAAPAPAGSWLGRTKPGPDHYGCLLPQPSVNDHVVLQIRTHGCTISSAPRLRRARVRTRLITHPVRAPDPTGDALHRISSQLPEREGLTGRAGARSCRSSRPGEGRAPPPAAARADSPWATIQPPRRRRLNGRAQEEAARRLNTPPPSAEDRAADGSERPPAGQRRPVDAGLQRPRPASEHRHGHRDVAAPTHACHG